MHARCRRSELGRESDTETGLYYYRARYYDQNVGRFLSEDRLRFFQDGNFYRYATNDPVNEIDPSGCGFVDCAKAVAELTRAIGELLRRQGENVGKCPDPGHAKAIAQAANRVRNALKAASHCLSPEDIRLIEVTLGIAALAIIAPELLPAVPELLPAFAL